MLKRLRIQFVCVVMAIVALMLAVIFGLMLGTTRARLERESLEQLSMLSERTELRMEPDEKARDDVGPERRENLQEPGDRRGFQPYLLLRCDRSGALESTGGNIDYEGDAAALLSAALAGAEHGVLSEQGLRYLRTEDGAGYKIVFVDVSAEQSTLAGLVRTSLLVGLAALAVFFLLSLLLARWMIRPVEEAWQRQKQFVSDASHELKTPLTVITTNAELLQSPDFDETARRQFSEHILTMARQMRGLVEGLLDLARVESGAARQAMTELNYSELCAEALLPFEPVLFERGHGLRSELEPDIFILGSEALLRQSLEILLDNAGKYAKPETEISVTLRRQGRGHCLLTVANAGDPIPPEDLPRLFERFYRVDKARSRDGSYGLGLAIARQIAELHRGKIRCECAEGEVRFHIQLPTVGRKD